MNVININNVEKITKTVVTHDGAFHADEVLGVAVMSIIYPGLGCVRTRDRDIVALVEMARDRDIVALVEMAIDVGHGEFDHHQRGGNGSRENGSPYAASGLVWRKFGERVFMALGDEAGWPVEYYQHMENVVDRIDKEFITLVDEVDCGKPVSSPAGWGFSALIAGLNPASFENASASVRDEAFLGAVKMAKAILVSKVKTAVGEILAEAKVSAAVECREHEAILVLPEFLPWQKVVKDNAKCEKLLYVVFPSFNGYNVQAVPTGLPDRSCRKLLPESWRGLPEHLLKETTGVEDVIFCHQAGFIGGAQTLEGAISLALASIAAE